jgi:pimeloyl-ACP methyl ester carboxylesterase
MRILSLLVIGWGVACSVMAADDSTGATPLTATGGDRLISLSTRDGVTNSYWWMPRDGAQATVLLFSGGSGGMGLRDGEPKSGNFLIRSKDLFAQAGLNVALMGNPSDNPRLSPAFRRSPEHVGDVAAVVADLKARSNAPVWLVGTSQGTISAAAAAVGLGHSVQGVVLTSTLTGSQAGGSVSDLPVESLTVPVLLHQHAQDACVVTPPQLSRRLLARLIGSPVTKYMEVEGGKNPTGSPCEAFHYHGYVGIESDVVRQIANWIFQPVP